MGWTSLYVAAGCSAAAACLGAMPLVVSAAKKHGVVGLPTARKLRETSAPRLGGMGVALPTLLVGLLSLLAADHRGMLGTADWTRLLSVLSIGGVVMLLGLCDDLFYLPPRLKFAGLIAAATGICAAGLRIDAIVFHGLSPFWLGAFSWPITIFWIVGLTVSLNFSDGLDGLAAGFATIGAAVIAGIAVASGNVAAALLALCLLGSLSGSLLLTLSPARSVAGDCGSMFAGFMLATVCLMDQGTLGTTAGLIVPAIALSVPITDAFLTLVRRALVNRRSLFCADRNHIHFRLLDMGLIPRHAVMVLLGAAGLAALLGLMPLLDSGAARVGGFAMLAPALLAFFRIAGSARLHETIAAIRRNRALTRESRGYLGAFEEMQLQFRSAESFDAWWSGVCLTAAKLDFAMVRLPLIQRDRAETILSWQHPDPVVGDAHRLTAVLPLADRRCGAGLRLQVAVAAHTSLESAGKRLSLFTRLMSDFAPASLPQTHRRGNCVRGIDSAWPVDPPVSSPADAPGGAAAAAGSEAVGLDADFRSRMLIVVKDPAGVRPAIDRSRLAALSRGLGEAPPPASRPAPLPAGLRVAIVHDFLYVYAGAEKVLEQIIALFPDADLFSLVDFLPKEQRGFILNKPVKASFLQKMPLARRQHRAYLPLMPLAVEQLDVSGYDLVLSSSYLAAKGVMTGPDQLHICYCHTPPRFAWDLQNQYLNETGIISGIKSMLARLILHYVRHWDSTSANAVDVFVTNSDFVGRRIQKVYRRSATTIYPPVALEQFSSGGAQPYGAREDFYMTTSRLVPYKRVDLMLEAFNAMPDRRFLVVGEGPLLEKLRAKASPNVRLVGHVGPEELKRYLHLARAFIFAAEEDFGIVPVEAQACGTPVIAFGRGGVTESVIAGKTGVFFQEQSAASLIAAVQAFEAVERSDGWDARLIRENARRFSIGRFREEFLTLVRAEWERFGARRGKLDAAGIETGREMQRPLQIATTATDQD